MKQIAVSPVIYDSESFLPMKKVTFTVAASPDNKLNIRELRELVDDLAQHPNNYDVHIFSPELYGGGKVESTQTEIEELTDVIWGEDVLSVNEPEIIL